MDFDNPNYYINRELSWLDFNFRVLEEVTDKENPLFEKLKFLSITASNLDEFFMVRVGGLKELINADYKKRGIAGYNVVDQLKLIREKVEKLINSQYSYLKRVLLKNLKIEGIFFNEYKKLNEKQRNFVEEYFYENIFPVVTPMAVDSSRPFPLVLNKSLNIVVKIYEKESINEKFFCVVQVPSIIERFIEIPSDKEKKEFVMLEEIIKNNLNQFFEGYIIDSYSCFRITRNTDMNIDESEAEDLLIEIERSLKRRKWGFPVRLEVEKDIEINLLNFLKESLEISDEEIYKIPADIDLTYFMKFASINGYENLKYEQKYPVVSKDFYKKDDYFTVIKEKDILLHHPYQTFEHIIKFVEQAAIDPDVLAIKQTLYRVSGQSPIIKSLIKAAENGKQVTVLIELKARFDEERNIEWAKRLEKSGCHVVYGLSGLKIHSKVLLVVRKEEDGIRRYLHLGTGNYNDTTAKLYTDLSLFTCREPYCMDASSLFNIITGFSQPKDWRKLYVAPFDLRENFYKLVDNEIENIKNGKEGYIIAKINSLVDKDIIKKLYEASHAGVKIDLIVRGMCCLRTGIKGISENISVRSIVGRFLEHSRIYYFKNGGKEKMYLSSADLMTRNLDRRIEVMFPVEEEEVIQDIKDILNISICDTLRSRIQNSDGSYTKVDKRGKQSLNSQDYFYKKALIELDRAKEEEKQKVMEINI